VKPAAHYIGRFAPSPTGPLHFGSLVAAVASYADARAAQGRWLLRIEDVDIPRCTKAAETEILRQLTTYGFEADGAVLRQSQRTEQYESALGRLHAARQIFACTCTRKLLEGAPRNAYGESIYPGRCRGREPDASTTSALRLLVPENSDSDVTFTDRVLGSFTQNVATSVGDFILRRADGLYAYQLAVVVDDAAQGVTDVVRGDDLLMNTPRQVYLQRRLDIATPSYLHVPLVKSEAGEKLSKQTLAQAIRLDNAVLTLQAAWAFLKQPDVGDAASVAQFWQRAFALWNPTLMRAGERGSKPTRQG
jgi:glutamyl-Q tRNA(Asp) synthetase